MPRITIATLQLLFVLALACGPSDPLEEIRELQGAGQFADTVDPLRRIIDDDPSQTEAALLLGRALLHTGHAGLAVWPLRKAAETPEYAVEGGLLMAQAMLESRTAHDALREIDRVLAIDPDNLQALMLRVEANRTENNLEESLADIDRVLEKDPDNLPVLVTRVTVLIALNRIEEAGAALDTALESFRDTEAEIASAMLARLCVARALFTLQKGEHETAESQYAGCADQFPTEQVAVSEIVTFYDRIGQPERGTEVLERAAEESETGLFRTLLARRLGALGEKDEEERLMREEAETRNTTLAWFVLADHYVERDRFDDAVEAFERALSIGPPGSRLRFAYADTLVQAERYDEARRVARRLEETEFRSLIMGRILLAEGNPRAALAAFEKGIQLWPNNAVGRFMAGQAAERVGDFPRAVSHYRESFRTAPGISEAGRFLAELYALRGAVEDALQIASRYVSSHRRDPDAFLMAVRLAQEAGREAVVAQGLQRLSRLPGQAAVAVAEAASLRAAEGNTEQAVQVVEESGLDLADPSNAIALRILVEQLGALGQHEKAAGLIDAALEAHPDQAVFHELRGSALLTAGRATPAGQAFERSLELDDRNWRALAGQAALAAEAGDPTRALTLYDDAIEISPQEPGPALGAIAVAREMKPEETATRLESFIDQHPRAAAEANELARLLTVQGDLAKARSYAARAAWFGLPEAQETLARIDELQGTAPAASNRAPEDEPNG